MKRILFIVHTLFIFLILIGITARSQAVIVDFAQVKQEIDGFGASSAWHGQLTNAEADAAFGNETIHQMGLSILRVRISPNSGDWAGWFDERANATKAKARGAIVLASPWSPPASMKTNNNTIGGELKPDSYAAYVNHLNSFCTYLGNVDVVSIQNEPNIQVGYESCDWSPQQLLNFCKNHAQNINTLVMMPEAFNFDWKYSDPILNDSTANSHISFVGGHIYGTRAYSYTNAINKGKRVWMTEHYYNDDSIEECLKMAKEIAEVMSANMNAYIWWWLRQPSCNLMLAGGTLKKKGYTMGQFSKFIRPGYHRVDATFQPRQGVVVVAFKGNAQNVIVAVNQNTTSVSQTFLIRNEAVAFSTRYVTSETKSINEEGTITIINNRFTDVLDPKSITTYVIAKNNTSVSVTDNEAIRIFPNPAGNYLHISPEIEIKTLEVLNLMGQVLMLQNGEADQTLDISALTPGIYLLRVKDVYKEKILRFIKN